jgi:hypothetical protein
MGVTAHLMSHFGDETAPMPENPRVFRKIGLILLFPFQVLERYSKVILTLGTMGAGTLFGEAFPPIISQHAGNDVPCRRICCLPV